jgi:hypothetical protein
MKKYFSILIALIAITMTFSSCKSLSQFSTEMVKKHDLDETRLKQIQFYNGADRTPIILEKELKSSNTSVIKGKLIIRDGQEIDRVIIKPGTKGAAFTVDSAGALIVCFSKDNKNLLTFGPDATKQGNYILYSIKNTKKELFVYYGGYGEQYKYKVASSFGDIPGLYLNLKELSDKKENGRVEKGRKIRR